MTRLAHAFTLFVVLTSLIAGTPAWAENPTTPVALAWDGEGNLRVALREARRVLTIEPADWRVKSTRSLSFRPNSLALASDRSTLLIAGMDGELLAIGTNGETALQAATGRGPTRILPLAGARAAVVSIWDPSVRFIDWRTARTLATVPLAFPPGAIVVKPDGRLIVADAFGNRLADVDPRSARVRGRTIDGVNLRAMTISGDGKELLVVHADQYDPVPVTASNIDWGLVLSSRLSAVRLTEFDDAEGRHEGEKLPRRRLALDGSRHGAADPSALAVAGDGRKVVIALAGAHQLLQNDRSLGPATRGDDDLLPLGHNLELETVEVGRSPVAVVLDPSGKLAITADSMSDTLSVVRLADYGSVARTVRLGPGAAAGSAEQRGEALFQDGRLALDRWMSCSSCHNAGHTAGLAFDTLGDGNYGAPKNTPSLHGVGATEPFAWTGRFATLTEQVEQSIVTSLRGAAPDSETVADLTAYLRSLPSPPPRRSASDPAALRGETIFNDRRCATCHKPPEYTTAGVKPVGLDDGPGGHRAFNPPSLRGVGWTAPYFHDGRAARLEDVLDLHTPGEKSPLGKQERDDLRAFLESL